MHGSPPNLMVIGVGDVLTLSGLLLVSLCSAAATADEVVDAAERPLCGAYCLYIGALALDSPVKSLDEILTILGEPPKSGYSFAQLAQTAEKLGLHSLGVDTTQERLRARDQRLACIAHVNQNHFVNIADITDQEVVYFDPPGIHRVPRLTFNVMWDGRALLLARDPLLAEEEIVLPTEVNWREMGFIVGVLLGTCAAIWVWYRRHFVQT